MTLILDLDGVVLKKNAAMNYQFSALFQKEGISPVRFWRAYRQMRKVEMFSPHRLWKYFPPEFAHRKKQIAGRVLDFFKLSDRYMYTDAVRLIQWAHSHDIDICLYTHGEDSVQGVKVRSIVRRYPYLRAVITSDPAKKNDFKQCLKQNDPWIWVDDSPVVAKHRTASERKHFLYLRRSASIPVVKGVKTIRVLSEAPTIIQQILNQE